MVLTTKDFKSSFNVEQKKAEKKNFRRKWSFILLLSTVLISFILWGQTRVDEFWTDIFKPAKYHYENPLVEKENIILASPLPLVTNTQEVNNALIDLTKNLMGIYGVYYYDIKNNKSFGFNENIVYTAASINKVPIMVSLYQYVETGKFKESQIYRLQQEDIMDFGTGQMRYQDLGTEYTYGELVELSGKLSDNTAAYVLEKIIGRSKIQNYLNSLGLKNTVIKDNTTTPKEMGNFFVLLYQEKLLNKGNTEKIYAAITDTEFEDRIPKGVPDNIRIAHKIGNEVQTYNDCGIIFSNNPYILCILSKDVKEAEAFEVEPKISQLFWQYNQKE